MRFYTEQHQRYCGIDLHARPMYVCIVDNAGEIHGRRDMTASPAESYHEKLVGKYGKAKALAINAKKLGQIVCTMLNHRHLSIQQSSSRAGRTSRQHQWTDPVQRPNRWAQYLPQDRRASWPTVVRRHESLDMIDRALRPVPRQM